MLPLRLPIFIVFHYPLPKSFHSTHDARGAQETGMNERVLVDIPFF
jgi:hypothetical protein